MTAYNKLKIAILAIMAAPATFAVNVDPVQIQSGPGELLYAEINFRQSNNSTPIEVSLASTDDLTSIGAAHQPPGHLNFYTRRNSNGTGVITITSSRPITERELNIIIKIKEGNASHLQHIRKPLQTRTQVAKSNLNQNERPLNPIVVVSEKDIGLTLPVSTHYTAPKPTAVLEKPLAIQRAAPPLLSSSSIPKTVSPAITSVQTTVKPAPTTQGSTLKAVTPAPVAAQPEIKIQASNTPVQTTPTAVLAPPAPITVQNIEKLQSPAELKAQPIELKTEAPTLSIATQPTEIALEPQKIETAPEIKINATAQAAQNFRPQQESNDPLVKKFADQQATQSEQVQSIPKAVAPIPQQSISVAQAQYVVQSNESLWKIAERVAQAQNRPVNEVMQNIKKSNEHAFIGGDANRLRKGAALNLNAAIPKKQPIKINEKIVAAEKNKPAAKTKYRINQAEMSLVAENQQDSKVLSANQNTLQNQSKNELSLKVMTAREKTVKLQRNVTEIELALNQKDHRIQLLNARLARLEQQLKAQQADKKPIH